MRSPSRSRHVALALTLVALVSWPRHLRGAGIGRPNVASARALGWGGAFTAVADDASALHHNPAGMASQARSSFMIGTELVVAPRSFTPVDANGNEGKVQSPANTPIVLPTLGYVTRLAQDGVPSRLALGIGFWNTFGGQLDYEKGDPAVGAVESTQNALLELCPGLAYEVNDFLQLGAVFRLGFGLFSVKTNRKPVTADLSAFGVGAGLSLGAMVSPTPNLRIGATWRSGIAANTHGTGTTSTSAGEVTVTHMQRWPQQASLGAKWQIHERLGASVQADWTDWSVLQTIVVDLGPDGNVKMNTDFHDSYALHIGAQFEATTAVAVRGGYTFDSNAVPDRTIERQYLDGNKSALGVGATWKINDHWHVDGAFEMIWGPPRHVPNNSAEYANFPTRANVAPGIHEGQVYSLEVTVGYAY